MQNWEVNRGSAEHPSFQPSLRNLGINEREWDELSPHVDQVLCGASDDKLDAEFPPSPKGSRMIFTSPYRALPALRIGFRVDQDDNGKIVYVVADAR